MATVTTDPYTTKPVDPIDPKWDPNCPGCLSGIGPDPSDPIKYDGGELATA